MSKETDLAALPAKMHRLPVGSVTNLSALARRFRVRRDEIESYILDARGFDLLVGIRAGNGTVGLPEHEWSVERFE